MTRASTVLLMVCASVAAQQPDPRSIAERSVFWFNRWRSSSDWQGPSHCIPYYATDRAARLLMVRCDKPPLDIIISRGDRVEAVLDHIGLTEEESLRRFNGNARAASAFVFESDKACITDIAMSQLMADRTLAFHAANPEARWNRLLFPFVCRGDPVYHVYALKGNDLVQIYRWWIDGDGHLWNWTYDRDLPQRTLPSGAATHLKDPTRWYRDVAVRSGHRDPVFRKR